VDVPAPLLVERPVELLLRCAEKAHQLGAVAAGAAERVLDGPVVRVAGRPRQELAQLVDTASPESSDHEGYAVDEEQAAAKAPYRAFVDLERTKKQRDQRERRAREPTLDQVRDLDPLVGRVGIGGARSNRQSQCSKAGQADTGFDARIQVVFDVQRHRLTNRRSAVDNRAAEDCPSTRG